MMFLYIITASEFCHKIGMSADPKARLNALRTGHYQDLKLVFEAEMPSPEWAIWGERAVHKYFASVRIRGEWFTVPVEDAKWAVSVASEDAALAFSEGYALPSDVPWEASEAAA
jgi:predicted GIY-YIG superfamily endonuclease